MHYRPRWFSPDWPWPTIGLATALLLAGALVFLNTDGTTRLVLANPADLPRVQANLNAAGVEFTLFDKKTIVVGSSQGALAADIVKRDTVPAQPGMELMDKASLGQSAFKEGKSWTRAMEGELSLSVQKIQGVTQARVHIAVPEKSVFTNKVPPTKVGILLVTTQDFQGDIAALSIREIVSAGVPGAAPDNITIVTQEGVLLRDDSRTSSDSDTNMEKKVHGLLSMLHPDAEVVVRITTTRMNDRVSEWREMFTPNEARDTKTVRSEQAQGPENYVRNYEINKVVAQREVQQGTIQRINTAVVVSVPDLKVIGPKDKEAVIKLVRSVVDVAPSAPGVVVEWSTLQKKTKPSEPSLWESKDTWFPRWPTIVGLLLTAWGMWLSRSVLRNMPAPSPKETPANQNTRAVEVSLPSPAIAAGVLKGWVSE